MNVAEQGKKDELQAEERLAWANALELRQRASMASERADVAWRKWERLAHQLKAFKESDLEVSQ